jgi:hypothetical protein
MFSDQIISITEKIEFSHRIVRLVQEIIISILALFAHFNLLIQEINRSI